MKMVLMMLMKILMMTMSEEGGVHRGDSGSDSPI
jgi:hypothetical protein